MIVTSNDDWEPVRKDFNGTTMVLVPKGEFLMGSTEEQTNTVLKWCTDCEKEWYENEKPAHKQVFDNPFWIDETEVTRSTYESCVSADVCTTTQDNQHSTEANQPINSVTWYQAAEYCGWRGARLPTEREWEYAARGPDNFVFPWGYRVNKGKLNFGINSNNHNDYKTVTVGSYPDGASWVGALDMSGNVWEWTSSLIRGYPYVNDDGRELAGNEGSVSERIVLRGGSFSSPSFNVYSAFREKKSVGLDGITLGFRCARSF